VQVSGEDAQHEQTSKPETQQEQKKSKSDQSGVKRMTIIVPFIVESIFQLVTWVIIAAAIGGIYYFAGKENWRGVLWSCCVLICSVVVMLCIVAQNHFSKFAVQPEQSSAPPPAPRAASARSFAVEYETAIVRGYRDLGGLFWFEYRDSKNERVIAPAHVLLYIRLTNLRDAPVEVAAYTCS
jgi:flagellar basal body-associated protein FliL